MNEHSLHGGEARVHALAVSHDFTASAACLWRLLENFADIEAWWPADEGGLPIEQVVLEGEGVGMTRHITHCGSPAVLSERLDYLDPASRTLKLSIIGDRPGGLLSYQATARLEDLAAGGCRMHYGSEFTCPPGLEDGIAGFLNGAFTLMFAGLAAAAAKLPERSRTEH